MSFMVEKGIRERICQALYRYAKANNKYIKDYDRNKESLILNIEMKITHMDGKCHKSSL